MDYRLNLGKFCWKYIEICTHKWNYRALEAILISVTSSLQSELDILDGPVNKLLGDLEDLADIEESMNGDKLRDLLQFSKKLSKFEQDALSIRDALEEVLDNGNIWILHKKIDINPANRWWSGCNVFVR